MLFFAGCGYDHQAIDDGFVYEPFPFWKDFVGVARRGRRGFIPDPENIPRNIPVRDLQKVLQFQGLTKNIPNIPNIPGMPGMRMVALAYVYT